MSASTTQARRGIRGERLTVLTVLLGMLLSLVAVLATAQPAFADSSCDGLDGPAGRIFERFEADLTRTSGTEGPENVSVDTDSLDMSCIDTGNAVAIYFKDGSAWGVTGPIQVQAVGVSDAPNLHLSCSESYEGERFTIGASEYTASNTYLTISSAPGDSGANCVERPEASLTAGACEFSNDTSTYPVTYSLEGEGSFSLFVDGVKDDSVTLTEGVDQALDDFAPGTALEIRAGDSVLASITVPEDTCPPEQDPTPSISLVKDAVVGEGSDLIGGGPNPLLQFSDTDTESQTALYSYLITNTGDEALVNISLTDDRIGAADLDFSDCTAKEPLAPGGTCTATGSEDFTLEQAQAVVDGTGIVTNTGTVTADGEESEEEVTDTDPATIAFELVFSEVQEKPDPAPDPEPAPDVEAEVEELPAPEVESAAEELPATGLEDDGLLPLALLLIAMGGALLWLDRSWVGAR